MTLPILTTILYCKQPLPDSTIMHLVSRAEAVADSPSFRRSIKYIALLQALLTRYPTQCEPHMGVLTELAERCNNHVLKSLLQPSPPSQEATN